MRLTKLHDFNKKELVLPEVIEQYIRSYLAYFQEGPKGLKYSNRYLHLPVFRYSQRTGILQRSVLTESQFRRGHMPYYQSLHLSANNYYIGTTIYSGSLKGIVEIVE